MAVTAKLQRFLKAIMTPLGSPTPDSIMAEAPAESGVHERRNSATHRIVRGNASSSYASSAISERLESRVAHPAETIERTMMGYVFLIVALTLNAAANLLMKIGADRLGSGGASNGLERVLTNYYLLGGLALFALNVVFYVAALTRLNLSFAYPVMMAGGVLIVVCVSVLYFREPLTLGHAVGIVLLLAGLVLVTQRAAT